jgi:16S rRNA G966 N2-methylase RsmD
MLAMFAATGSLAIESSVRGTAAQTAKRIEQYAPELDLVVSKRQ